MGLIREYECDVCGKREVAQETTTPPIPPFAGGTGVTVASAAGTDLPLHFLTLSVVRSTGNREQEADLANIVCSYDCAEKALGKAKADTAAARGALTRKAK